MTNSEARLIGDNPASIPPGVLVALDTETTGLSWKSYIIGVSLSWRGDDKKLQSCYLALETTQPINQLSLFGSNHSTLDTLHLLTGLFKDNPIVFHTISFDYRFLFKDLGLPPPDRPVDIVQLAKCSEFHPALSLVELFQDIIHEPIPTNILETKKDRGNLHNRDIESQAVYARWDAEATLRIGEKLHKYAVMMLDTELVRHDEKFTNLVMKMIERGVPVDRTELARRHILYEERLAYIVLELANTYKLYDVGSVQEVSDYLYKKLGLEPIRMTASGRGAVGAEDIQPLAKLHPSIPYIIEFRQLTKAIGTWLKPLDALSKYDGRAHCQLDPFGTRSFRMSCKDINLQAMPMKERGERAFEALHGIFKSNRPGEELWALDLKQAEVRLGAIMAPDPALARVFNSGSDPYKVMSMEMWGTEARRQEAKQATLSAIYEIGPRMFSLKYGVKEDYAREVLDDFRARFPGIKRASNWWSQHVEKRGYVKLYTGRLRWFGPDDIKEPWKGFNQVIQGGVAEMMSDIMLEVERVLPDRLVLQIHDSLIMHLPADERERVRLICTVEEIAQNILPPDVANHVNPRVPILLDAEKWE